MKKLIILLSLCSASSALAQGPAPKPTAEACSFEKCLGGARYLGVQAQHYMKVCTSDPAYAKEREAYCKAPQPR